MLDSGTSDMKTGDAAASLQAVEQLSAAQVQERLLSNAAHFEGDVAEGRGTSRPGASRAASMEEGKLPVPPAVSLSQAGPDSSWARQVTELALEWQSVTYSVSVGRWRKRRTRCILDKVHGQALPGHLLAVMGPTGCGKTSLLNALAGRLPLGGVLEGSILVNGSPRSAAFKHLCAYVMQDDVLFSNLTVRETLNVAAALRLPGGVSNAVKEEAVEDVILELGLIKAANTRIGSDLVRGVSGGERKRVNIGVELLSRPSLICLDEPTSGLDAFQAQSVMKSLWGLAHHGRTVVATIHQPRSSIYGMFDQLLLLSEGQVLFRGSAGQATDYFASLGFHCPPHYNPADYFLDVASMDYRRPEAEKASRERIALLAQIFKARSFPAEAGAALAGQGAQPFEVLVAAQPVVKGDAATPSDRARFKASWPQQFRVVLGRSLRQTSRDTFPQIAGVVQAVIIALVLGAIYSDVKRDQKGIQDVSGLLFFVCVQIAFNSLIPILNALPREVSQVSRERAAKSYHVSTYYLSKVISEAPLPIFQNLIFCSIVYWMSHLNRDAARFFIFVCIVTLEAFAAQALGLAIGAGVKNEKVAFALAPGITIILLLFSGFYINPSSLPRWLFWIQYISHVYWAFSALIVNEFHDTCCWSCTANEASQGCLTTGQQILDRFSFGGWAVWKGVLGVIGMWCAYNLVGYTLLRLNKPKFQPLLQAKKAA